MQGISRLDKAVKMYVIILDTSFAMQDSFEAFLNRHKPALQHNQVRVPFRVVQELNSIIERGGDRKDRAALTNRRLEKARSDGIAEYRRDPQDDNVINDAVISRVVEGILPHRDVLVLTHDEDLCHCLRSKTQQRAFRVHDLIVAGVNAEGELFAWPDHRPRRDGNGEPRQAARQRGGASGGPVPFPAAVAPAPSLQARLPAPKASMGEGDTAILKDGSRIILRDRLASGGEGVVFKLDDPTMVCKVYHDNKLTVGRQEKIELMLTRAIDDPMICWPRAAIYDSERVFRGFTMPRAPADSAPLGHGLFIPREFLKRHLSWTRLDSALLARKILWKLKFLHKMNVLVGDINPMNILIKDDGDVFLVDCDSFQIGGYPCPVGTVNFTAPEIQGKPYEQFLRTTEHELFSVATLLFMIFMPGKSPYSHQGGADGAENIRTMHFPYALGERASESAPPGPWPLCWSHLPRKMKDAFHTSFHEEHRDKDRVPIEDWISLLNEYIALLTAPDKAFMGPERRKGFDLSVLPKNLRRVEKDGVLLPPWPNDTLTDADRMVRSLVANHQSRPPGDRAAARPLPRTAVATPRPANRAAPAPRRQPVARGRLPSSPSTPTRRTGVVRELVSFLWTQFRKK